MTWIDATSVPSRDYNLIITSGMKGELTCEYCSGTAFEENGEGDAVCQDCGRVLPKSNFAEDLQYNQNQEVQGERVNLNSKRL